MRLLVHSPCAMVGLLFGQTAIAWNARGHMMVAAIAFENMDADTRTRRIVQS